MKTPREEAHDIIHGHFGDGCNGRDRRDKWMHRDICNVLTGAIENARLEGLLAGAGCGSGAITPDQRVAALEALGISANALNRKISEVIP